MSPDEERLAVGPEGRVIFGVELTADLLQQLQTALGAGYRFDRELGAYPQRQIREHPLPVPLPPAYPKKGGP